MVLHLFWQIYYWYKDVTVDDHYYYTHKSALRAKRTRKCRDTFCKGTLTRHDRKFRGYICDKCNKIDIL